MGKKIIHDGPVNTAVVAWMRGQGIKPEDVRGYTLTYDADDLMTIDIRMIMEDVAPVAPKFNADDTLVTLGAIKPIWPARVRDGEGDEFVHQGGGVYRMVLDGGRTGLLGSNTFTFDEIKREYGIEGDSDAALCPFAARFTANGAGVESWIMERVGSKGIQAMVVQALIDATPLNSEGLTESEVHRMVYAVTTPSLQRSTWKRVWQAVTDGQGYWRDVVFPMGERRWIAERPRDASDS